MRIILTTGTKSIKSKEKKKVKSKLLIKMAEIIEKMESEDQPNLMDEINHQRQIIEDLKRENEEHKRKIAEQDILIEDLRNRSNAKPPPFDHVEIKNFVIEIQQTITQVRKFVTKNEIEPLPPHQAKKSYRALNGLGLNKEVIYIKSGKKIGINKGLNGMRVFHTYPCYKCE